MNGRLTLLAALACALLLAACAGSPDDPRELVDRMIDAYGGDDGLARVEHFTGKGFMRSLSSMNVVKSYPFDLWQNGNQLKTRMMLVQQGRLTDVKITVSDGEEAWQFDWQSGYKDLSGWETDITAWRFPRVLRWAREHVDSASVVADDHEYGLALVTFQTGEDVVTLKIDESTWLLREVAITNPADSSFRFVERYEDYREVDGTPFPNRFIGTFREKPYFEYMIPVLELGVTLPDSLFGVLHADTVAIEKPPAAADTVSIAP